MSDHGSDSATQGTARSLLRTVERLLTFREVEPLLDALAQEAAALVRADGGLAGLYDGQALTCQRYWRGAVPHPLGARWLPHQGLAGALLVQRRALLWDDTLLPAPSADIAQYRAWGVRSVLALPLLTPEGQLLGFVEVHRGSAGLAFGPAEQDLLSELARLAATALANVLEMQRLRHADDAMHDVDRRKNEFLATLAHELRNPLAPIRHALQMMQLAGHKPQMLDSARAVMERQVQQLVRLVDDLLDVARVSTGRVELQREWVDLGSAVHHAVETVRPQMVQRGQRLRVNLPPNAVYLDADAARLAQVFIILLDNASKFTPVGGRIALTAEAEAGAVLVKVSDTGRGIAPDALPRLFDPFTRIDRLLDRAESGLGVGLSLARKLVELHGGRIEASSPGVGQGSEFCVRLPLAAAQSKAQPAPTQPASLPGAVQRVLLVDDNPDTVSMLASLLAMMGHEVKTATGGVEALEAGPVFHPDVVLLDIGMPGMDGYETARRLRGTAWGKDAALVAATGWGQPEDKQRAFEAGFNAHMTKPIDPDALSQLLAGLAPAAMAGGGPERRHR
ncbi:ATP-binding protein [Caldimonas brevitalea]|uniref:histidine kinase n=1 Tax=Caldimonas brevitalea TaxID=413882 RepID=A0A0G3BR54_9BURK|nr:ATP-binding protein [Caldimonas brevitalea]AKJ29831.1 chemotaxis protein methyltransferase CheR [Caldimonas brevitalea]